MGVGNDFVNTSSRASVRAPKEPRTVGDEDSEIVKSILSHRCNFDGVSSDILTDLGENLKGF